MVKEISPQKKATETSELYGPAGKDLPLVEQAIQEVGRVEFTDLASLAQHVLGTQGKRLRPAMTLLSGSFAHYNLGLLVPMAASVELLHTASLVHDDTLDGAVLRRGTPTINHAWNDHIAVLLGDYLFAAAAEMVARTANVRVMRLFAETLRTICSGELAQQFNAYRWRVSREEYYQRIGRKTASLFAMAAESGAVLSGAPEQYVQPLKSYGYALGVAFQIGDDIFDVSGDEASLGKPVGSDLLHGTLTLPAILLTERNPSENPVRAFIEGGCQPQDLAKVVEALRDASLLAAAYQVAGEFCRQAATSLTLLPNTPARHALAGLIEYALGRKN